MNKFLNALMGKFRVMGTNNRKETKGRPVRKQYAPRYSQKELEQMKKDGKPSYFLAQCARRKILVLHEK